VAIVTLCISNRSLGIFISNYSDAKRRAEADLDRGSDLRADPVLEAGQEKEGENPGAGAGLRKENVPEADLQSVLEEAEAGQEKREEKENVIEAVELTENVIGKCLEKENVNANQSLGMVVLQNQVHQAILNRSRKDLVLRKVNLFPY